MPLRERLRQVFVTTFELPPDVDVEALRQRVHPGWDSIGHMSLVVAIEDEFGVELGPEQMVGMDSFQAATKVIRELGVAD
jgi:acyl carrier protein